MSSNASVSVVSSVDVALGLFSERDTNLELDKNFYGDGSSNKNEKNDSNIKSISVNSTNLPQNNLPRNNPTQNNLLTTSLTTSPRNVDDVNLLSSKQLDVSQLYLIPTIYPPNNGNHITDINQLVDPLKLGHMMSMFDSVPALKTKIDPLKFEGRMKNSSDTSSKDTSSADTPPDKKQEQDINDNSPIYSMIEIISDEEFDTSLITEDRPEIDQGWDILDIATKAVPKGWIDVFKAAIPELTHISASLEQDIIDNGYFFPYKKNVFKAFDLCPLDAVKVVIIGQDPYHSTDHNGGPVAMGMSFSVSRDFGIPPSLRNIYNEIERTIPNWKRPSNGDLTAWAKQGVLLLNMCLTVRPHKAKSHGGLWMGFITKAITAINEKNPKCIFVMWGKEAQKVEPLITNKNISLITSHPSAFSVNRGFNGCGHFSEINKHLTEQNRSEIDWNV